MNWETAFIVIFVGIIFFLYQFGQDLFEKTKMYKRNKKKGEENWTWATTPPYFTFKKILYWIFLITIVSITLYLGLKVEMMM